MVFPAHWRMYLAAFLLDFSVAVGFTAMPFFIFQRLHGGPAFSGTVGATQMAVYALSCLASAGFVSRARNGLHLALAGLALFVCLYAAVPWVPGRAVCGIVVSLAFVGLALAWPALQSWLGGEPDPDRRSRHLTGFNMSTALGFTLGPLLAGPLYDLDYRLPFAAMLTIGAFIALLIVTLPGETERGQNKDLERPEPAARGCVSPGRGLLYASWGATFTANALFVSLRSVYPKQVETLVGQNALVLFADVQPACLKALGAATVFSWLAALLSAATVLCFLILGRTRRWQGRFGFIIASQAVAAGSLVLLGRTQSLVLVLVSFMLVGANFGLCFFSSLFYSLADARGKHRNAAINEGLLGAGGFVGGIGMGWAAETSGLHTAFQWAPAFVGAAMILQLLLLRRKRLAAEIVRNPGQ